MLHLTKEQKASVWTQSSGTFCYAVDDNSLCVRIKAEHGLFSKAVVCYKNLYRHDDYVDRAEMQLLLNDGISDLFEAKISLGCKRFKYYFELFASNDVCYFGSDGFTDDLGEAEMFYYPYVNTDEVLQFPSWAKGASVYQVLVDRFFDGDSANNPPDCKRWGVLPDRNTYFGGDFDGLIKKMDYFVDLGVDILYLSPLFKSPTYHKYDVSDYYSIEEIYGGSEKLKELVSCAHEKGIKVMLDCVFNHCSITNPLFADVVKNGQKSKYRDWFCIDAFPVDIKKCNYDTFGGLVPSMPRFNTSNPEVINYLVSVAEYWTKQLNVDCWRLDVADEVSHLLWRAFRTRLLAIKPDILIVGEVWNHATQWLNGDEMHTVTNYKFRKYLLDFAVGKLTSTQFWNNYNAAAMLYKTLIGENLINLVGSHDTARLATLLGNDNLTLCVLVTTLTFKGMPLIYYGDETAMQGDVDPDNRRAMDWSRIGNGFATKIVDVAQKRKHSAALRLGSLKQIDLGERVLAFERSLDNEKVFVAINFDEKEASFDYCGETICLKSFDYLIKEVN